MDIDHSGLQSPRREAVNFNKCARYLLDRYLYYFILFIYLLRDIYILCEIIILEKKICDWKHPKPSYMCAACKQSICSCERFSCSINFVQMHDEKSTVYQSSGIKNTHELHEAVSPLDYIFHWDIILRTGSGRKGPVLFYNKFSRMSQIESAQWVLGTARSIVYLVYAKLNQLINCLTMEYFHQQS